MAALKNYKYDDHSSIPFKLVILKRPNAGEPPEMPHRHNFHQIFFFTEGEGEHLIDFEEYPIKPGGIHIVNPGTIHRLNRSNNVNGYVLLFSRLFYQGAQPNPILESPHFFLQRSDIKPVQDIPQLMQEKVVPLLEGIRSEWQQRQQYNEDIIRSYLHAILFSIQRSYTEEEAPPLGTNTVDSFKELINKHFDEQHSVSDYASLMGLSADNLSQQVKQQLNKTASELIQERLLLESKRLLFHSGLSAKEIAFALGYEDPAYFSRFFKKHEGLTPMEYREQIRKKYKA